MTTLVPENITILRESGGSYIKGRWTPGTRASITITGRCRHFEAYELYTLPEGKANIGHIKIYCNSPLTPAEEASDKIGDIIIWENKYWEVTKQTHKPMGFISHYKYTAEFRTPEQLGITE